MSEIDASGIEVRETHDPAEHRAATELMAQVWGQSLTEPGLLTALAHSGNHVAGAYRAGELLGISFGFLTADGMLHSHATAVRPDAHGLGLGRALKLHQRDWARARGLGGIVWTFDPLVRRNAHFNMHVLGALPVEYLPDFYGAMRDRLNDGVPSDRLFVRWALDAVPLAVPDRSGLEDAGARVLLRPGADDPEPGDARSGVLLVAVPPDVERLREEDGGRALTARYAVRAALAGALAAGARITGITRDGFYVLEEKDDRA
ncbi:putative GNAT superfamily acetyltransferase [Actinocorallia herbida]|uniref:Putative GNAT superfamily acetyltransferase n=1 Tax=Actinocorallia herbida TaxID=58109 RepID=A0A3N1D9H1_9ACTN|nr:GNAT family N-acetyltransferase [Actinocorallia herbida]ROO89728.1 putative GNAT superfamily acetyltransferase [Actinocorallia herbida]